MAKRSIVSRVLITGLLVGALALGGCGGGDGAPGAQGPAGPSGPSGETGPPGVSTGVVTGKVTNNLTGTGIAGAAVATAPVVAGVSILTGSDGGYSASLPVGVYTLTFSATNFTPRTDTASVIAGGTATKNAALDPVAPVVAVATTQGTKEPGNTLTVAANVTRLDGSDLIKITWTQKSGAAVVLGPPLGSHSVEGNTVQVALPNVTAFKNEFFRIVDEERHALLDRNMVIGITPLDLEEAGKVVLTLTVQTSKGTLTNDVAIPVSLPFAWSAGIRNVPIGIAVLLHGKVGSGAYNWTVTAPGTSQVASVNDASTQNPYFTPDVAGEYMLTESNSGATVEVHAGTWVGAIGPDGKPSALCASCHSGTLAPDMFTAWKQSGHAHIFTQNLNAGGHYGSSCFPCHTVGYSPAVNNAGFDDGSGYANFLNQFFPGGHAPTPSPNNWANMLASFPDVARLANIQCENCHGPNASDAHGETGPVNAKARVSLSSDVCGVCHGEPARHGRFQQWQESGHANYELALTEATVEGRGATAAHCGRCHSGQGFLAWIEQGDLTKQIQGANGNATVAELRTLGLTKDAVHTQTCATCHDPHAQGTTSGEPNTATVRISGDTPLLPAGYQAIAVGRGAVCITCHNTRNGAHNDGVGNPTSYSAPHSAAQGDVLMGQNAYFVEVGQRAAHSFIVDTCTTCHMELTPPPPEFSFSGSGTNHSFKASLTICGECHGVFDGGTLQEAVEAEIEDLAGAMSHYLMGKISAAATITIKDYTPHTSGGKSYDLKSGGVAVPADTIDSVAPTEPHGQQGFIVTFKSPVDFTYSPTGESPHTMTLIQATVQLGDFTGSDGTTALIATSDPLVRSGWNYFLIHGDKSKGVHNPGFVQEVLAKAQAALQ